MKRLYIGLHSLRWLQLYFQLVMTPDRNLISIRSLDFAFNQLTLAFFLYQTTHGGPHYL